MKSTSAALKSSMTCKISSLVSPKPTIIPDLVKIFLLTFFAFFSVADDGYRSARERAMLKRYDANGDGELDAQEREQFKKEVEAEQKVWLERYDLDGDGEISSEEKKAAKVKLESAKKKDPGSKVPQKVPPKPLLAR